MATSARNATTVETEVFECDYENDCPPLYESIEAASTEEDHAKILKFLETGRWEGSFLSLGASPETQAKTWVTRFDPKDAQKVKWSQLSLHLAIVCGSPFSVVKKLVELYPQALRCTDDQHMLPLHLALRHGSSDETIAFLVKEFPEAINAKGKNGRTAVECAQRAKNYSRGVILEAFVERTKSRISKTVVSERATMKSVIESKKSQIATLHSELDAQYSVVEKLRAELAKARYDLEQTSNDKTSVVADLCLKVQELEQAKEEAELEKKETSKKLESSAMVHTIEVQKKIDQLEAEKKEMKAQQRKMEDTEASLRKELVEVHERLLQSISPEDWKALKKQVEALHNDRLMIARDETKLELEELREELEKSPGEQKELASMKKTVDILAEGHSEATTASELESLRAELKSMREELKDRKEASKTKSELAELKKSMEIEMRNSEGKAKEEVAALKRAIELYPKDIETKTTAELAKVKGELEALRKELIEKDLFNKTKKEADELHENLMASIKATTHVIFKKELQSMEKTVSALHSRVMGITDKDEMIAAKKKIASLKDQVKKIETSYRIQEEALHLKEAVDEEIKKSQGKTQDELMQMKTNIKSLMDISLGDKTTEELARVREELATIKNELKHDIQHATNTQLELTILKKALEVQLQFTAEKAEKDLQEMKKAVDTIDLEHKESKKLKKSLGEEIKQTNGKTEKELLKMKKALDSINLSKLESNNKSEWEAMRKEMASLKAELEAKKVVEMSKTEKELAAMKKVVEAIDVKELETKTTQDFESIRQEMNALQAEFKEKEDDEAALKRALEDLKERGRERAAAAKKDKAGLKKFLSRRFSRIKQSSPSNASSMGLSFTTSIDTTMTDVPMAARSPNSVPTILPPSLSNDDCHDTDDTASNSSEYRQVEMSKSRDENKKTTISGSSTSPSKQPGMPPLPPKRSKSTPVQPSGANDSPIPMSRTFSKNKNKTNNAPIPLTRTSSKTLVQDNGEVELEAVEEPIASSE